MEPKVFERVAVVKEMTSSLRQLIKLVILVAHCSTLVEKINVEMIIIYAKHEPTTPNGVEKLVQSVPTRSAEIDMSISREMLR